MVLHNGRLNRPELCRAILINCGPRALLTSFTVAEERGLRGWQRREVHVLAPSGTHRPPIRDLILHRTGDWSAVSLDPDRRCHAIAPALVIAAGSFSNPKPGCGLFAAAVQQRICTPGDLRAALERAPRARHRRHLLIALGDIEQGAHSLAEIDFGRLCRRYGLPKPSRQRIRVDPRGRRRYLDAEWRLPDGRIVIVEVDGAAHTEVMQWEADQLRQNDMALSGPSVILRYPASTVRHEPARVAGQLSRALGTPLAA